MIEIETTPIKDLFVLKPRVFRDTRGYFVESFRAESIAPLLNTHWVQDNESESIKGVLRGLHYQVGNKAQAKLVRVIQGRVYDVVVDIRPSSPNYGDWFGLQLSGENKKQILIPRGFAHGYLVLSEIAILTYKCDQYYDPDYEGGIRYDDHRLNIHWPKLDIPYILSDKDKNQPLFGSHRSAND